MREIFILAPYPKQELLKDGMIQRIYVIDRCLSNRKKIYIDIGWRNRWFSQFNHDNGTIEFQINALNIFAIIKFFLRPSQLIYIHSLHSLKFIPYFKLYFNNKLKIILDAHGVVPEEMILYYKKYQYSYYGWLESQLFSKLDICICVTNSMISHFKRKYSADIDYHYFSTSELMPIPNSLDHLQVYKELGFDECDTIVIYSGNNQAWQNIPLMIKSICNLPYVKILVLTGEENVFKEMFKQAGIPVEAYQIISVPPPQLYKYYSIANYGFILRNDDVVNRVANPTKMLEYLQFGIIPIVLSPKIGDYYDMDYEYVEVKDLKNIKLTKVKSQKNRDVSKNIKSGGIEDISILFD